MSCPRSSCERHIIRCRLSLFNQSFGGTQSTLAPPPPYVSPQRLAHPQLPNPLHCEAAAASAAFFCVDTVPKGLNPASNRAYRRCSAAAWGRQSRNTGAVAGGSQRNASARVCWSSPSSSHSSARLRRFNSNDPKQIPIPAALTHQTHPQPFTPARDSSERQALRPGHPPPLRDYLRTNTGYATLYWGFKFEKRNYLQNTEKQCYYSCQTLGVAKLRD